MLPVLFEQSVDLPGIHQNLTYERGYWITPGAKGGEQKAHRWDIVKNLTHSSAPRNGQDLWIGMLR